MDFNSLVWQTAIEGFSFGLALGLFGRVFGWALCKSFRLIKSFLHA